MKVKRANRLISIIDEIWVIHLQKVDNTVLFFILRVRGVIQKKLKKTFPLNLYRQIQGLFCVV
jgi:hypothetical protein